MVQTMYLYPVLAVDCRLWTIDSSCIRTIPARLKGIETGYAYDPAGNCGKDCKVCKSWNSKMATNPTATLQEIERRKKEEHWE